MQKNYLFYLANLAPELGRISHFYEQGKGDEGSRAQSRAVDIITSALSDTQLSPSGRAELTQLQHLVAAAHALPTSFSSACTRYALVFAERFAAVR